MGIFLDQAIREEPLTVVGDGTQSRDFTYVDDTVGAILIAGADQRAAGTVFNVSAGQAISVNDVVSEVQQIFPDIGTRQLPLRPIDEIRHRELDSSHIENTLGWKSTTSLQAGLLATRNWVKAP